MYKKFKLILVFIFIFVSLFVLVNAKNGQIRINYNFPEPKNEKINIGNFEYDRIIVEGLENYGVPGNPVLPIKTAKILIPQDAIINKITVNANEKLLYGAYDVEPGQTPIPFPISGDTPISTPPTLKNKQIYGSSIPYPEKVYSDYQIQKFVGYNVLIVNIYPIKYIPKEKKIYYFTDMEVVIDYETPKEITKNIEESRGLYRGIKKDSDKIREFVDNEDISSIEKEYKKSKGTKEETRGITGNVIEGPYHNPNFVNPDNSYDYIIITNNELKNSNL